jgi:hypothetical protein
VRVLAIDPGTTDSAVVLYDNAARKVVGHDYVQNEKVFPIIRNSHFVEYVIVEMVACYGMPVGAEIFETCVWIGRFLHEAERLGIKTDRIKRLKVKMALCHDSKANDANIRQAIIDLFGPGRERAIGTKKMPGPLYGISGDLWAALAVAIAWRPDYA